MSQSILHLAGKHHPLNVHESQRVRPCGPCPQHCGLWVSIGCTVLCLVSRTDALTALLPADFLALPCAGTTLCRQASQTVKTHRSTASGSSQSSSPSAQTHSSSSVRTHSHTPQCGDVAGGHNTSFDEAYRCPPPGLLLY
eukprot:888113-Amphidinium_carterae.1